MLTPESPFLRSVLKNLRVSFFLIVAAVGAVVAIALVTGEEAEWDIVIFLAVGMLMSSIINALYDDAREKKKRE